MLAPCVHGRLHGRGVMCGWNGTTDVVYASCARPLSQKQTFQRPNWPAKKSQPPLPAALVKSCPEQATGWFNYQADSVSLALVHAKYGRLPKDWSTDEPS